MYEIPTMLQTDEATLVDWPQGRSWVIELRGEFDIACREVIDEAFQRAATAACDRVVADARAVTFLDAAGLEALLAGARACDREVWLRCPSRAVLRIAQVVGLVDEWQRAAVGEDMRIV